MVKVKAQIAIFVVALFVMSAAPADESEPQYPYRVDGVCPFECCQYGTWTARDDITVYAKERDTSQPVFTIKTGQSFLAEQGAYWTVTPLIIRPKETVELHASGFEPLTRNRAKRGNLRTASSSDSVSLPAGKNIHVLANLGEGAAIGMADGKLVSLDSSMYAPIGGDFRNSIYEIVTPPQIPCTKRHSASSCRKTAYYTKNVTEWWVEVKTGDRRGWFERGQHQIEGTDACGG